MAVKLVVRWTTRDRQAVAAIRERFDIPSYTTVNGWSPAEIKEEYIPLFEECARSGLLSIIDKKWCKNG